MPTENESYCCQEMEKIISKLKDISSIGCITEHAGFRNVCLDQQSHHVEIEDSKKSNRYVAYKQLVRWCWGWLGKNIRIPLPSCVFKTYQCNILTANWRQLPICLDDGTCRKVVVVSPIVVYALAVLAQMSSLSELLHSLENKIK
ncbi:hypothetical protein KUTeg_014390 [Tegillarca granosa]|uniref:Uncharacterized protein n=1 Tax=Tegillarca granosa TaxID=220873 RepID=A0ABQ9EWF1_TEGGR|nr:hypothetical protein KUTeg_014390 [Tegillarca granosa]